MRQLFFRALTVATLMVAATVQTIAQNGFAYQAVIRDSEGNLITNQKVGLRFSLLYADSVCYAETQDAVTNQYGNISVVIGNATKPESGSFAGVPWNTLDITLKVEVKPEGTKDFKLLGQTKINPAPYAMYAAQGGGAATVSGATKDGDPLFQVNDRNGNPVFAVTPDGIVIYVDDSDSNEKVRRSGFFITGRESTKGGAAQEYFSVTPDGTQVYVDADGGDKVRRSGFYITGRESKGGESDYLTVDGDGTKVYVDAADDSKVRRRGFFITGRDDTKADGQEMFAVDGNLTKIYVDDDESKVRRSGFLIVGRNSKSDPANEKYMAVTSDRTDLSTSAFTVTEHNSELGTVQSMISVNTNSDGQAQVVVHTDIAMEDEVIEVTDAPMQGEYAVAVNDSMWFIPAKVNDYNYDPEFNQLMAIYGEGEYAPAVSVKIGNDDYSITIPSLFFDGEGNPTSNAKKATVVVFEYPEEEGVYIIRPFVPMANKTIEFGLMNTDGEFVKITAQINSKDGVPFGVPVGDFEGGKITNAGGGYFGSTINLVAVPDKGKIFAGWQTTITIDIDHDIFEYPSYRREYPLNGLPLIDEKLFGSDGWQLPPVFTAPELYVSYNAFPYGHGFSDEWSIKSIDQAIDIIAEYVSENLADNNLDWTINVVDWVYGAQDIPESTYIEIQTPDQPSTEEEVVIKDIVKSIRLTGISEESKIDGSWWYAEDEGKWYYSAGVGTPVSPLPALTVNTQAPVIIDNLTITRGHADYGGGIFMNEGANVTIADGVEIVGNTAQFGGGIFLNEGANVTIADGVEIVGNTAESGGGVYLHNGAKFYMTGGVINQNAAESENSMGGGICATANSLIVIGGSAVIGDQTIADASKISGDACANRAKMGGGIYSMGALYLGYKLKDDATELTAANLVEDGESSVTIQGNYASVYGGGGVLYSDAEENAAFMVYKTDVLNNRTDESYGAGVMVASLNSNNKIDNCHINGNYNVGGGAGLNISGNLTISNTEFSGNTVGFYQTAGGAGVAIGEGMVVMDNCNVHDNTSESYGGGIRVEGTLYANNCQIYGNKATSYDGGGIMGCEGSTIILNGSTVVGDADAKQKPTSEDAGAEEFKGNEAGQNGAGIHSQGQLYIGYNVDEEFRPTPDNSSNVKICGNYSRGGSDYHGGGISDGQDTNEGEIMLMMHNATVAHNTAGGDGNGVYIHNGTITVNGNTTFDEDNDVYLDNEKVVTVGALDESAAVNITIETIRVGTKVLEPASGIELADYINRFTVNGLPDDFSINNNGVIVVDEINVGEGKYFESIAAAIDAINAMDDDDSKVYTINIVSDLNEPQNIGGDDIQASKIILKGTKTTEGDVTTIDAGWRFNQDNNTWENPDNPSPSSALFININIPVTIQDLKITGGYKNGNGGGICVDDGADVTVDGVVITGNGASTYGGGVYVSAGKFNMVSGSINGNTANSGGGVTVTATSGAEFTMSGGEISGNSATSYGSGVYLGTCKFTMSDEARIDANNDVYLAGGQKINIGGKFSGTGIVATITPTNYGTALGNPVLGGEASLVESECGRFAVTPGGDKFWRVASDGKLQEMIGSKLTPDAVGDIVFTDGSAAPYTDGLSIGQKNAAVAVIFDAENKKGVALGQSSDKTRWCANNTLDGYEYVSGACDENNGLVNTNAIYELSDFEMNSGNYPPFEYAKSYTAGGYTDWYIPAIHELDTIYSKKDTLNAALDKIGGTKFIDEGTTYYWSSSQDSSGSGTNANYAWSVRFDIYSVTNPTKVGNSSNNTICYSRCVRQFGGNNDNSKLATYYVAPDATNSGIGNDSNNGLSGNTPFATVAKAISMMTEAKDYQLVVCGCVKGNQTIQSLPEGSTLTIMGHRNNETDALDANGSGAVLEIKTSVPITIKDLKITNGGANGIKMEGNTDVTLGAGALVKSNNASQDDVRGGGVYIDGGELTMLSGSKVSLNMANLGGGIFIASGKLTMLSGSEVSSNTASVSGGGVDILENATFDMKGGTIQYNQAGYLGKSVFVNGKFNMSGGSIESNPSYSNGGDVYVCHNAEFNIKGSAIIDDNDYVLLNSYSNEYATINIDGVLEGEGSDRVAIIIPDNYVDNIPLLTSSVPDYLPAGRFVVGMHEGNIGNITSDGKLELDITKGKGTMKSIKGKFSVSADKKVQFSSGNLRYYTSQPIRWEFAANQYDALRGDNIVYPAPFYDASFNTCIDLFGYGTSGYNDREPTQHTTSEGTYISRDITGDDADYDWGVKIRKDYKTTEQWRTLTESEWTYLLSERTNAGQLYGLATVVEVNGIIILPDNWSSDGMPGFTARRSSYTDNTYNSEQWSQMEEKGAVFLPVTGYRNEMSVSYQYIYDGYYWTSTAGSSLHFSSSSIAMDNSNRSNGYAVRLVHDYDDSFIGTKAPGSKLEVGDIVFSDGSATSYTEASTLDNDQKAAAIAVIFYVGTDGDALGNRTLGIGKYNSTANGDNTAYAWATGNGVNNDQMQTLFADILSYTGTPDAGVPYVSYSYSGTRYITGDLNGSDNWGKVKEKDSNYEGNYPGFEWVDGYANRYNLPDNYKDGWYLPSAAELIMLWKNLYRNESANTYTKKINTILETIGGTALKDDDPESYLTSNITYEESGGYTYISIVIGFDNGTPCHRGLGIATGYVCAIREF